MLAALIRWSVEQRVLVAVLCCAVGALGAHAARTLSVDAFPDVTNVQVQVATEAPGLPPTEVERFVTIPIEIAMTGLPGLVEMRSLNRNGISLVTLVFTDHTDLYFARQMVMERLMEAGTAMPPGIRPVLGPVTTGLGEVYQYTVEHPSDRGPDGRYRPLSREELIERRTTQDWVIRPLLRSIPGVAEINTQGGLAKQYLVYANPDRLRHFGLTVGDLHAAVSRNNANSSGGILPQNAEQYLIRGRGLVRSLEDIAGIVVRESGGTPVYVRDIAEVAIDTEQRHGAAIKNGETEMVAGIVQMVRGGNAREVVTRIKDRVEEINRRGLLPGGLHIVPFYDRTVLVESAMDTIVKVLLEGVVLVVVILFVFLGDVRSSIVVVATLCLTPLLTFMLMNEVGLSANLMSLGGLAIAIGLMVDGSVVVVENTFARLGQRGSAEADRMRTIVAAASEVGKPVLYGVGIIIVVFLPLLSLEGMEGKLFAPLALTIAIALSFSLLLSFTMSPMLCSYILKGGADHDTWLLAAIKRPYLALLHLALRHRAAVVLGAVAALAGSLMLVPLLGTAFIPVMQEGSVTPVLVRAPRIAVDESIRIETEALRRIMSVPGVEMVVARLGRGESPADAGQPHESDPIATLAPRDSWPRGWTQGSFNDRIREALRGLPGVELSISQPIAARVDEMVSGVRSQVAVKIFGENLDALKDAGDRIATVLRSMRGATDLRIERGLGAEYLDISIDRDRISRFGLNVEDVNDVIEIALKGREATVIYEGERRFPALVRFPSRYRENIGAIGSIVLQAPNGALVRLRDVAEIDLVEGPAQISREGGRRRLVVGVNVTGRDLGGFVSEAQERIESEVRLPEGYSLSWGGQFENMQRALTRLSIIIPLTIAAIFFLLFMLFGSLRHATLVITVLPLAAIGGVIGLLVSGQYLSVPAAVGFINLWGIAVLNGVVLVSFIRQLRTEGRTVEEAVVEGCTHRLRPVMMTASVAMLALIPMLLSTGPGSEVTRPLAVVVIGGLFSSTALTLLVIPCLYGWFEGPPAAAERTRILARGES